MNPTNISNTANGEAAIITATGQVINNAVSAAAASAVQAIK